jgi:uncharacterized membrane protein
MNDPIKQRLQTINDPLRETLRKRRDVLIRRNLRSARWTRRWLLIVICLLSLYVGLPFAAPTLMAAGAAGPAEALYTMYSPMCHQFSFRSFFLFGEQAVYPRDVVNEAETLTTFEEAAAQSPTFIQLFEEARRQELRREGRTAEAAAYRFQGPQDLAQWTSALQTAARRFHGDEKMGYKVALCERDIAIYSAMAVGGIAFYFVRRRLRPAPVLLYVLLGLGPIGIDGFSQLLSYPPFEFWSVRETLPEFRVLTGALFGLMNIWMAFPYLERSMRENARQIENTIAMFKLDEDNS